MSAEGQLFLRLEFLGRIIYSVNLLTYSDMSILAGIWDKTKMKKSE